ncbi:kinase-like protein [Periconia macrospinosa]|uniref:non-specific serine/threonine protein kinase n=1 Tax=Periconia macrospinosa TaxID=97972 RepID=A0A2V1D8R8_9PLEO|nr:kinase-like protein [Periconia macrospinosa]
MARRGKDKSRFRTAPEYFYFGRFDPWAKIKRKDWTTQDRKNTREYIWYNDFNFRAPFERAKQSRSADIPPWSSSIVPAQPYNKGQRDDAFRRAKSGMQNEQNPTGVQNLPPQQQQQQQQQEEEEEEEEEQEQEQEQEQPVPPQGGTPLPTAPSTTNTAVQYEDPYPYSHWPQRPWGDDPDMPLAPVVRTLSGPSEELSEEEMEEYENAEREKWKQEWLKAGLFEPSEWGDDSDTWVGTKYLGEGEYGSVGLWEKMDRNGNVIDQVVCKDVTMDELSWRDPILWRRRLPQEIAIHRIIDHQRETQDPKVYRSIVAHRGYRLMMAQQRFRLYLEYIPKADLGVAMRDRFWMMNGRKWNTSNWSSDEPPPPPKGILPEPFIWHVFRELVRAIMVLTHGHEDKEKYPKDWRPIVHRDINLENVFLNDRKPEDEFDESWPRIVLADFGLSFYELERDHSLPIGARDNPREYRIRGMGEVGDWGYPVEYHVQFNQDLLITEKSDIFQVGWIIYQLMGHRYSPNGPHFAYDHPKDSWGENWQHVYNLDLFDEAENRRSVHAEYSSALFNLVELCLSPHPAARPTIEKLKEYLEEGYETARDGFDENDSQDPNLMTLEARNAFHKALDFQE